MKHYNFNYLKKFKCTGENCKHSCCEGWQIEIDKKTLSRYKNLIGVDKRFLTSCFDNNLINLNKNLRCPFLDGDNLCHVIKNYGEKALSKTCKTHPRFKNFFKTKTETGLGLYCEEACRIILDFKYKIKPVLVKTDNKNLREKGFNKIVLSVRKKAIDITESKNLLTCQKLDLLSSLSQIDIHKNSYKNWVNFYCTLETIKTNAESFSCLKKLNDFSNEIVFSEKTAKNLLAYLLYRHISSSQDLLDLNISIAFSVLSFLLINNLATIFGKDNSSIINACRFYSSTIELSPENLSAIYLEIEKLIDFRKLIY